MQRPVLNAEAARIQADHKDIGPPEAQMQGAAAQPQSEPAQSRGETAAPVSAAASKETAKAGAGQAQADGGAAEAQRGENARIGELIRSIFIWPDTQTGRSVKKTATELSQTVGTLKSALVQSDINNKEVCIKLADQAQRQLELNNRTVPFEYMQLPVALKDGQYQTAELFVFKRQGKQKTSGEAGFTILVALDTQHIGRVETLIREAGGSVSLEFRLEQPETMDMFKRNEKALERAVDAAGYRLTGLRYAGLETKTSVLNAAETAGMEAGDAAEGVDVRI
jgi:Flagellar hook-length control protein FliK.